MKTSIINKVLNPQYPIKEILERIEIDNILPILKTDETCSITDDNNRVYTTTFYCPTCNNEFFAKEKERLFEATCPFCGTKSNKVDIITTTLQDFGKITPINREYSVRVLDCNANFNLHPNDLVGNINTPTDKITKFFILSSCFIDNVEYFNLAECAVRIVLNYELGTKEARIKPTRRNIIFTANEILNIKEGKKSSARFENTFCQYRYANYNCDISVVGNEEVIAKANKALKNMEHWFCGDIILPKSHTKSFYTINVCRMDEIAKNIKAMTKKQTNPTKKALMMQDILNRISPLETFEQTSKSVIYTIFEENSVKKTINGNYLCPFCGEIVEFDSQPNDFLHNENAHCAKCGKMFKGRSKVLKSSLEQTYQEVAIIQNFDDGLIVYNQTCSVKLVGKKLHYTIKPNYILNLTSIYVIKPIAEDDDFAKGITILRKKDDGNYAICQDFNINDRYVNSVFLDGTNLNVGWSGIVEHGKRLSCESIAKFLLMYQKYPVLEKILKAGYWQIVDTILSYFYLKDQSSMAPYDLTKSSIHEAFNLTKGHLKLLSQEDTMQNLRQIQHLHLVDANFTKEDYDYVMTKIQNPLIVSEICRTFNLTVHQICEYIERVRISQCLNPEIAIREWKDYLNACKLIGSDLSNRKVKYPVALRTEHDKVVFKQKIIEDKQYEEAFRQITEQYGKEFYHKGNDFIITYPHNLNELFEEGRVLNHCVGSYGDIIKNGTSIVLFVRKAEEPKVPYYTIEINPSFRSIVQFAGYGDKAPARYANKKLVDFVEKWADDHEIDFIP